MNNRFDWDRIISSLASGQEILPDPEMWNTETPGYLEIYQQWQAAKFNMSSIRWTNYYPGKHFDLSIEKEIAEQLNIVPLRSWISCIDPGYCAPWHWDVDDNETEYLSHGELCRYTIFIQPPQLGHFLVIGEQSYYKQAQGDTVVWPKYDAWHAASNAGLSPYYLFHILGYHVQS